MVGGRKNRETRERRPVWALIAGARPAGSALTKPGHALRALGSRGSLARFAFSPLIGFDNDQERLREGRFVESSEIGAQLGSLEMRLACDGQDLREAQRLRFRVFYEEMSALANPVSALLRRDADRFDRVCDHLIVVDRTHGPHSAMGGPRVVGTYRLLRQDIAQESKGFYASGEYDLAPLLAAHRDMRFLELGRSCVLASHRDKRTLELLWRGIHAYVRHHRIDVMIGCASLAGTDPGALAEPLSFLHHYAPCAAGWQVRALPERHVPMNIVAKEELDARTALRSLPALIRGYLRLGARFGDGAVIDRQFGTTDVFVLLRTSDIAMRYRDHFGAMEKKRAA